MAKVRQDEVLAVVPGDSTVIPRYDLIAQDGTVIGRNVSLVLKNQVIKEGMAVDKKAIDECLAASGMTTGTTEAYNLQQPNYAVFDGAPVRVMLHATPTIDEPTLNINGTGAKKMMGSPWAPIGSGVPAGTWLQFAYSAALDAYVMLGSLDTGGGSGDGSGNTSMLEDLEIMAGEAVTDKATWKKIYFPHTFFMPPVVTCTQLVPAEDPSPSFCILKVKNVTVDYFEVAAFKPSVSGGNGSNASISFPFIAIPFTYCAISYTGIDLNIKEVEVT